MPKTTSISLSSNSEKSRRHYYYPTKHGRLIRNAKSGKYTPFRSGTFDEYRYYRVIDSSAYCDENGFVNWKNKEVNREPNILFYNSPEEYAAHMRKHIPQSDITNWYLKRNQLFPLKTD